MAVFGRRQPHAPIILRAGGANQQPPRGRVLVFGQRTSQHAADRYYRRSFPPKIIRGGGRPSTARQLLAEVATRTAADRFFRRSFTNVVIKRLGPPRSVAQQLIVKAQPAWRPVRRPILVSKFPPAPAVVTTPIGVTLIFGQKTSQHAANRYWRRSFPAIIKRAGGQPAVGRLLLVEAQHARRPVRRPVYISPFPPPAAVVTTPIGVTLVFGQKTAQHAAHRQFRRAFAPIIKRGGPRPSVARQRIVSQAVRTSADRYFRRAFAPIIKRAGGRPAVGRSLVVQRIAQPATRRPVRRPILVSKAPPPPALSVPCVIAETIYFAVLQAETVSCDVIQTETISCDVVQAETISADVIQDETLSFRKTQTDSIEC